MSTNTAKKPETLEVTTPSDLEIAMTRDFDAPRRLVYDAHVKPELLRRWMIGPPGWTMSVCEIDLKVGGKYRVGWQREAGATPAPGCENVPDSFEVVGVYREIVAPERIVATEYMGPGDGALVTQVFTEEGERTKFTQTMRFGSQEERDVALKSGMAEGTAVCYDRLAEILADEAKATCRGAESTPAPRPPFPSTRRLRPGCCWKSLVVVAF
jgi:uncharacterized protein YndB with AHSA1/START domain